MAETRRGRRVPACGDGVRWSESLSWATGRVDRIVAVQHVVEVRLGQVAKAALEHDSKGDVVEGGAVGGCEAGADTADLFAHGGVSPVVIGVLD